MNKNTALPRVAVGDLRTDLDLTRDELFALLDLAAAIKANPRDFGRALDGKSAAMLFEKPSLRTRVTFEMAMAQMGGHSTFVAGPIGEREPVKDMARNLDRWVDVIVARTYSQRTVEELAKHSRVPVINALSKDYHPCQALADVLTIRQEFGTDLRGKKVTFVGDGFNVAHSLMLTATRLGMEVCVATPQGYEPKREMIVLAHTVAQEGSGSLKITNDPVEGVTGAHAVYTDVWFSMGEQTDVPQRLADFSPFQVNEALMAKARPEAIFLHCLPAKRGEETTDAVMESPQSRIFEEAENRLHAQKALLLMLL
ncbi:MAG: ornithine carbamoyltransferase [Acidobacteria bacterium]|nr:ornithine carbamoyltransferase [Acidobacteriota bacterium]